MPKREPGSADRPRVRDARRRILEAAARVFTLQGFNATSVNELGKAAKVSKRTLYLHFGSKDAVVLSYLDESERSSPVQLLLARTELAPRARLLEIFTTLVDRSNQLTVDPFVAAAVEFPDPNHPVHKATEAHAARFTAQLTELAKAAGARHPERTGRQLALLYMGASLQTSFDNSATVVDDAYAAAAAILRDEID